MNDIGIIIVFYYPTTDSIRTAQKLAEKYIVIVVDNTPGITANISESITYIPLGRNEGIAAAQNKGIETAISNNLNYICFFDQDSSEDESYPLLMKEEYLRLKTELEGNGFRLGVLGPVIVNKDNGKKYKSENSNQFDPTTTITSALISSGSFMEADVIKEVGLMDAGLFIDFVDFEWTWRAWSKGYVCAITDKIQLNHKVGDGVISLLGLPFAKSSPFRFYYQYRNYFFLLRRGYVPMKWKVKKGIKHFIFLISLPFIKSIKRKETLKYIMKGIGDGILNK